MTNPLLVSRYEAAALLGLSLKSLDLMIADGRLTPTRIGRRTMISRRRLEDIAENGIVGSIRSR